MIPSIIQKTFVKAAESFDKGLSIIKPYKNGEGYNEANLVGRFACAFAAEDGHPFFEAPLTRGRMDGFLLHENAAYKLEAKQLHKESISDLEADVKRLTETKTADLIKAYKGGLSQFSNDVYDVLICDCWDKDIKKWWMNEPNQVSWNRDFLKSFCVDSYQLTAHGNQFTYFWLLACRKENF